MIVRARTAYIRFNEDCSAEIRGLDDESAPWVKLNQKYRWNSETGYLEVSWGADQPWTRTNDQMTNLYKEALAKQTLLESLAADEE